MEGKGFWERWAEWRSKHHVQMRLEMHWPAAAALVTGVTTWCFGERSMSLFLDRFLSTAVSVSAILAGFQGTIQAMLLSMRDSRAVVRLRTITPKAYPDMGTYFDVLIRYLNHSISLLLTFVVLSLLAMLGESLGWNPLDRMGWTGGLLAGLLIWSLAASVRIIRIFAHLLHMHDDTP